MGRFSASAFGLALFGGVLAFIAIDNFRDLESNVEYAEANGVPAADRLVPLSSGMLLFGSLGVVLGRFPYFKSIYFTDPDGLVFEIATMGPGFTVDEEVPGSEKIDPTE